MPFVLKIKLKFSDMNDAAHSKILRNFKFNRLKDFDYIN